MFKRNYYILNYKRLRIFECYEKGIDPNNNKPNTINEMNGGDLIEKYYSNSRTNQDCELDTIIANSPQLSNIYNKIEKLSTYYKQQQIKKMDDITRVHSSLSYLLRYIAYLRELDLIAVKEKLFVNYALPLDESLEGLDILESYVEYFSNLGMTNADILIRCSTEITLLNISNPIKILPMTNYLDLLDYFYNTAKKLP